MTLVSIGLEGRRHYLVCVCDTCGEQFVTYRYSDRHSDHHFDTPERTKRARKPGGVIYQKTRVTVQAVYGVTNVAQATSVKLKTKQVIEGRYGTSIRLNIESNARRQATLIERYGTDETFKSTKIRAKARQTKLERFGVEYPQTLDITKQKVRQTNLTRYGVTSPFSSGSQFRIGSDELARAGQHGYRALVRKHGDAVLSAPEVMLGNALRSMYGDVEQQAPVNHGGIKPWLVDYYVPSVDVYFEADGVFWHGLGTPYDELHSRQRSQYDKDRAQDEWFMNNQLKLVRVTDEQIVEWTEAGIISDELRLRTSDEGMRTVK